MKIKVSQWDMYIKSLWLYVFNRICTNDVVCCNLVDMYFSQYVLMYTVKLVYLKGHASIFNLILAILNFEVGKMYMAVIFKISKQDGTNQSLQPLTVNLNLLLKILLIKSTGFIWPQKKMSICMQLI